LPAAHAKAYAESRGLTVEIVGEGNYVTSQTPKANGYYTGEVAKIILYTDGSPAVEGTVVPNVVGMTALGANITVADSGFNIKLEGALTGGDGEAVVVMQYPAAGSLAEPGSVIRVEVRYMKDTE